MCNLYVYSFQTNHLSLAGVSHVQLDEKMNQFSVILIMKMTSYMLCKYIMKKVLNVKVFPTCGRNYFSLSTPTIFLRVV